MHRRDGIPVIRRPGTRPGRQRADCDRLRTLSPIQSGIDISRRRAPAETYDNHFTTRFGLGVLGFATGAFIGYQTGAMIRSCDRCYFGGSAAMIIGTIAGALTGTSLLAMPSFGSPCTRGTRIRRALAGAGIGYLVGLVVIVPILPYPTPFAGPGSCRVYRVRRLGRAGTLRVTIAFVNKRSRVQPFGRS